MSILGLGQCQYRRRCFREAPFSGESGISRYFCCARPDKRRPQSSISPILKANNLSRPFPMKKISPSVTARATIGALFFVLGVFLVVFAFFATGLRSATPSAGTLSPGGPTVAWAGTAVGGGSTGESTCVDGVNCDTFVLTCPAHRPIGPDSKPVSSSVMLTPPA